MSPSCDHDWSEQRPEQPVRLLSPRAFVQWLEESQTQSERSEDSTQPVESPSTGRSPMTRSSRSSTRYQHDQPTPSSVQRGPLSSDSLSRSAINRRQPCPDQSNSWLPIRFASPKRSYHRWTQQRKVPPDPTPSVPVNTQPDRSVRVKFDDGDVTNEPPASAVGLQAKHTPADSTGSNPEDHVGIPSLSPVIPISDVQLMRPVADGISASISQAGEPSFCEVQADTGMSASNCDRRPDDDDLYYLSDEEIHIIQHRSN